MGVFSIDIEKIYEELQQSGQKLKGLFCIQYPIYCIHANITDNTSDPLDNLDKTIAEFLRHKPDFTSFQIGSLMGTSKTLVESRISKMIRDGLLLPEAEICKLSELGVEVFLDRSKVRPHKISYDFYMDGVTLQPLRKIFYTYYASKLISEDDSYFRTNAAGETYEERPFGPDLVHTPPHKSVIIDNISKIAESEREQFSIPIGLQHIEDISFTKLSLQILVAVSSNGSGLKKQLIDGFPIYSLSENISYYEAARRNVRIFEENIKNRIENLEFKIIIPAAREDRQEQPKPILSTNWQEIDKYKDSRNKCFSFTNEDLLKVVEKTFQINYVREESIVNLDTEILINITKKTLLGSNNRQKLVGNLIRERDYRIGNIENNVFLMYLYFTTTDEFVKKVIEFKKIIAGYRREQITLSWIQSRLPEFETNYRQLLIAAGENLLLEKLDMEKHMLPIK
jgi:hypothetical protein